MLRITWRWVLGVLPLLYLWGLLVNHLRVPWSTNPQYAYGWSVPFLCGYLLWQRLGNSEVGRQRTDDGGQRAEGGVPKTSGFQLPTFSFYLPFALCVLLYAPTRLIQEASPEWALVSWVLAGQIIGLTLLGGWFALGPARLAQCVFPVCFFLVAVPWPYGIEHPVIQGLTRMDTALTIEILGWIGIPAMQHGHVIELTTGSVGIDEACSGIRSLQATLMLSLFFGEFYRLTNRRRIACVLAGFGLALVCNLGRMLLLTWVAARRGEQAIAGWHDPAGVSILVACFLGLWLFALWNRPSTLNPNLNLNPPGRPDGASPSEPPKNRSTGAPPSDLRPPPSPPALPVLDSELQTRASRPETSDFSHQTQESPHASRSTRHASPLSAFQLSTCLLIWLVLVEIGVAAWYRHLESGLENPVAWSLKWPDTEAAYREVPIAPVATGLLRYDEAKQAQWSAEDGTRWQLSWFYWKPGKTAAYLAKSHNPLICMPAAGYGVSSVSPPQTAEVQGLRLPFRIYSFEQEGRPVHILYSRWDDRAKEQPFATEGLSRFNRLASVWRGRGNHGQRVASLAVWGAHGPDEARSLLLNQLEKVLAVGGP